jgi:hypothetical protein
LHAARERLASLVEGEKMDLILHGRVQAMVGLLNLFLDEELCYTWRKASVIVAKSQSHGVARARSIRRWTLDFLRTQDLPHHNYKWTRSSAFDDEDVSQEIQFELGEKLKEGSIKATDLVDVVASPKMQDRFKSAGIDKPSISERTAHRWMARLGWRYGKRQNGMYIDGHEREDVVLYRNAFVQRFKQYERRFHLWDDDGNELPRPSGFPVPGAIGRFRLILVTHDESTFFQNDQRKICWDHEGSSKAPRPKGEGQSLMISDFLTADWGCLRDGNRCVMVLPLSMRHHFLRTLSEARIVFKPGKNRDGWFSADDLLAQVENAIDVFEGITKGWAQGLFLFDNAPSHQKRADNAISARKMVKGVFILGSYTHGLHPFQDRRRIGRITQVVHTCAMAHCQVDNHSPFTSQRTIQQCQIGLKEWRSLSGNTGYGQSQGCLRSAQISSVPMVAQTAVAGVCFSLSLTSSLKSPSCKNLLSPVAISVISIPNTIVNLISLSNTGVQQSFNIAQQPEQTHSRTWKQP